MEQRAPKKENSVTGEADGTEEMCCHQVITIEEGNASGIVSNRGSLLASQCGHIDGRLSDHVPCFEGDWGGVVLLGTRSCLQDRSYMQILVLV